MSDDNALIRSLDQPRRTSDIRVARLSVRDAIANCPEDCERAEELLRDVLQLLEAER